MLDDVVATSSNAALRAHMEGPKATVDPDGGASIYVAVPERSWRPTKVTVAQTVSVKLGTA